MNRIDEKFKELRRQKKKALIVFVTAGDPSLARTEELIHAFEKDGVDLVELGVPFSDPLADGPVIQASSHRSLAKGTTLSKILETVRRARKRSSIPILLMSYLNPVFCFGVERFAKEAKAAGVDGLIVPDLPPEEGRSMEKALSRQKIDLVYLLSPTSSNERQKRISRVSRGFIYYVSLTGVTGIRKSLPADVSSNIRKIKRLTKLPVCVGFGISTPADARRLSAAADGVIVGSAVVRSLEKKRSMKAGDFSAKYIRPFARALGKKNY